MVTKKCMSWSRTSKMFSCICMLQLKDQDYKFPIFAEGIVLKCGTAEGYTCECSLYNKGYDMGYEKSIETCHSNSSMLTSACCKVNECFFLHNSICEGKLIGKYKQWEIKYLLNWCLSYKQYSTEISTKQTGMLDNANKSIWVKKKYLSFILVIQVLKVSTVNESHTLCI